MGPAPVRGEIVFFAAGLFDIVSLKFAQRLLVVLLVSVLMLAVE